MFTYSDVYSEQGLCKSLKANSLSTDEANLDYCTSITADNCYSLCYFVLTVYRQGKRNFRFLNLVDVHRDRQNSAACFLRK